MKEKDICKAFVARFEMMSLYNQFNKKVFLYHIPNEQYNNMLYTMSLKKMGLKSGVPDYCIMIEGGKCAYIEFKRNNKSKLSKNQEKFRDICSVLEFPYLVTCNIDDAITWIKNLID